MKDEDLERLVHRALRAVPPPVAPDGLLPRVLAAVERSHRPVSRARGWFTWPFHVRIAALCGLVGLLVGCLALLPAAYAPLAEGVAAAVDGPMRLLSRAAVYLDAGARASDAFWRVLQPVTTALTAVVLLMCVACVVFGSALVSLLPGRMAER